MTRKTKGRVAWLVGVFVLAVVVGWWYVTCVEVYNEYREPPDEGGLKLTDDPRPDKPLPFDDSLVDSRPLGEWEVNQSAAIIELDCPLIKPDAEAALLVLRPSYAEAVKAAEKMGREFLPSANLLDGAAKQFDDGLYAALDLACFRGKIGLGPAVPEFIRAIFDRLPQGSPARPFLAAALELAGRKATLNDGEEAEKERLLAGFERNKSRSKPISFYNWTPELQQVWRTFKFLQREFDEDLAVPRAVAAVLNGDPGLLKQYGNITRFYNRLTNPRICLSAAELMGTSDDLESLAQKYGVRRPTVAVFPPATSRETELFDQLFPLFLPPDVNLMTELIKRVRSGEVKLAPGAEDGWYQYQVHALEVLLMPDKAQEKDKLLLTAKYKKRLIEAFKALITKRRETHARELASTECAAIEPLGEGEVKPRLRIEPCPTFYLRTARAYAFLENFLAATVGEPQLAKLRGLKKGGYRGPGLAQELDDVRQRFYGFYLVACEDIGMRPQFLKQEPVDRKRAKQRALAWIENFRENPDLACDTRVSVPLYIDPLRGKTRLWATLGVRLAHLTASYLHEALPKVRPKAAGGPWKDVEYYQLGTSDYVIAVDEFAEFELDGLDVLTRAELRKICDKHKTRKKILEALD